MMAEQFNRRGSVAFCKKKIKKKLKNWFLFVMLASVIT